MCPQRCNESSYLLDGVIYCSEGRITEPRCLVVHWWYALSDVFNFIENLEYRLDSLIENTLKTDEHDSRRRERVLTHR